MSSSTHQTLLEVAPVGWAYHTLSRDACPIRSPHEECAPMLHADRFVSGESPHAPERLWKWEAPSIQMLIEHARACHRGGTTLLAHRGRSGAGVAVPLGDRLSAAPLSPLAETWHASGVPYRERLRRGRG